MTFAERFALLTLRQQRTVIDVVDRLLERDAATIRNNLEQILADLTAEELAEVRGFLEGLRWRRAAS